MRTTLLLAIAMVASTLGCGAAGPEPDAPLRLEFIADFEFRKAGTPATRVGANDVIELSGLAYDPATGELVAVADDGQPARLYRFGMTLSAGRLRLAGPREVLVRADEGGGGGPALDAEGVAVADGRYFVAVEGRDKTRADGTPFRPACAVLELDVDGRVLGTLALPPRYRTPVRRDDGGTAGPRDNGSFESVAIAPGGDEMFVATQLPLIEDAPPAGGTVGGVVRLLRLRRSGGTFRADAEFAYVLDPQPPPRPAVAGTAPIKERNNGLVELVALSPTRLLALEKRSVAGADPGTTSVRIYEVDLSAAADVSAVPRIGGPAPPAGPPARKRLVLDLAAVRGRFATPTVANFEGMTLGPRHGGRPTLILVSDDNGNDKRGAGSTVFAAFSIQDQKLTAGRRIR